MAVILTPFPAPPGSVQRALTLLDVLQRGSDEEREAAGDLSELPRPWDPVTCADDLREDVWAWCDQVAAWLNRDYAWRPQQMIPPCWPRHPAIARELPVLAMLRWNTHEATGPAAIEEWHRYALPGFYERMFDRLGESSCRTGKHQEWPAAGRYDAYTDVRAARERAQLLVADTRRPGDPGRTTGDGR